MLSPIENNGIISVSHDISIVHGNEANRAQTENAQFQQHFEVTRDEYITTVTQTENSNSTDTHHDAREKGKNEYIDMRRKDKKVPKKNPERVVAKGRGGFDVSI